MHCKSLIGSINNNGYSELKYPSLYMNAITSTFPYSCPENHGYDTVCGRLPRNVTFSDDVPDPSTLPDRSDTCANIQLNYSFIYQYIYIYIFIL